jgi:mono/diheme cytochrome c family protein
VARWLIRVYRIQENILYWEYIMSRDLALHLLLGVALVAEHTAVGAQSMGSAARGELLYTTHCIECHTYQVHWREKRLANNWATLQAQVLRWQANAGLAWSQGEIEDVSRYLNDKYYRFSIPVKAAPVDRPRPASYARARPG